MGSQQFCLKWNNHQLNMLTVFDQLLQNEAFVDVTLACDGLSLKAHKMVLSACSPYFQHLFMDNPCKHPIVILKDVRYDDMKAIIDFMYKGEVNVSQEQLTVLLKTAETLKVKGLAEVTNQAASSATSSSGTSSQAASVPPSKSHPVLFESLRGGRTSPSPKRKKRTAGALAAALGAPGLLQGASGHLRDALASLHVPVMAFPSPLASAQVAGTSEKSQTRDFRSDCEDEEAAESKSRSSDDAGGGRQSRTGEHSNRVTVKEERPDSEPDEPPDDLDDLILEATPEHIEIEPSGMDVGFNGSELESTSQSGTNYENAFSQSFQSTPGTSGGPNAAGPNGTGSPKRKSSWTVYDLVQAIQAVKTGQMNVLKAAIAYGIPKSSLYDYVNGRTGARLRLMKQFPQTSPSVSRVNDAIGLALPYLSTRKDAEPRGQASGRQPLDADQRGLCEDLQSLFVPARKRDRGLRSQPQVDDGLCALDRPPPSPTGL